MRVVVDVAPSVEPILRDDLKVSLRIDHVEEDNRLDQLITSVRTYFEEESGWALINRTLKGYMRFWPKANNILLPYPPLSSVSSVSYNASGTPTTLSPSVYEVDSTSRQGSVVLLPGQSWPTDDLYTPGVTVTYVAGFGVNGTFVPDDIIEALYLIAGFWYEYPEAVFIPRRGGADPEIMPMSAWSVIERYQRERER